MISFQFKLSAKFDERNFAKSKIQVHFLHAKGWQPVFELSAQDVTKLFVKRKRRRK